MNKRSSHHAARRCVLFIALLLAAACGRANSGNTNPLDNNTLATLAAQTLEAQSVQQTLAAGSAILTAQAGGQPATGPAAAELAGAVTISANVDTNCREGPGADFPAVGYLGTGQQSLVAGKETSGNWWYIENPKKPGEYCWVWAETTVVSGDTASLPILGSAAPPDATNPPQKGEPPAPPPANFSAHYYGNVRCDNKTYINLELTNSGSVDFQSAALTVTDLDHQRRVSGPDIVNHPFHTQPGNCDPNGTYFPTGKTGYLIVSCGNVLCTDLRNIAITIKLCSEVNSQGTCQTQKIEFLVEE